MTKACNDAMNGNDSNTNKDIKRTSGRDSYRDISREKRLELLNKVSAERILLLDGAMGTMIQQLNFQESDFRGSRFADADVPLRGNSDVLVLTQPESIRTIHQQYLEAGADIIETNTFGANGISQKDYGLEAYVYEMNYAAARIARSCADEFTERTGAQRFTAGSAGPTNKTASISPDVQNPGYRDVSFDDLCDAYRPQIEGLIDGGADIILIETVFDTLNCKAALFTAREVFDERGIELPLMVSGTITDASGRMLSGQTPEAFCHSIAPFEPFSVGLNCSFGAEGLLPYVEELSRVAECRVSVHPNAGLPDQFGAYTQSARKMADAVEIMMRKGLVHIVGGCCGSTPEHIAAVAERIRQHPLPPVPKKRGITCLSGIDPLCITPEMNFVNIGERTNVAGSKRFARLIREQKWEAAIRTARHQIENGAQIIDICMDEAMLDSAKAMVSFLQLIAAEPDIARVPVMVDSSRWEVIEAALKVLQGKSIVNSVSLKEGEEVFIQRARRIRRYGAAMVVMLFDEQGQADTFDRKIAVAERSYELLTRQAGIPPEDIIIDPNVLAAATGIEEHNGYARDFIEAVRWIKEHLSGVKVSGGVSNLSFAFRGNNTVREAMHSVFLYHAVQAGMDMGIVNPAMLTVYDDIPREILDIVEDALLLRTPDAPDRLIELAQEISEREADGGAYAKGGSSAAGAGARAAEAEKKRQKAAWRNLPAEERLQHSLITGITDSIDADVEEARLAAAERGDEVISLIDGPLMTGMKRVGELFGQGKMFLPQVVKSARVMKRAVAILEPYIEEEQRRSGTVKKQAKVLLATVKGDVHDIGKNLLAVVLRCNNYEVLDLGVMVPAEQIAEAVQREKPNIVGLSGLITPSLDEMVHTAEVLKQAGITIPLLIGGATTSREHTDARIAPVYSGKTVHVRDASLSVQITDELLKMDLRTQEKENAEEAVSLQADKSNSGRQKKRQIAVIPFDQARREAEALRVTERDAAIPKRLGIIAPEPVQLQELTPLINWRAFLHAWRVPSRSRESRQVLSEAEETLLSLRSEKFAAYGLEPKGAVGIFPVRAHGDDADVLNPAAESRTGRTEVLAELHFLRRQTAGQLPSSLADYLVDEERTDYIGLLAATAGPGWRKLMEDTQQDGDDYRGLMIGLLADRIVEAYTEYLHYKLRTEWWGYAPDEPFDTEKLLQGRYQGIRPAPGYPGSPDHSEKRTIFDLLDAESRIGVTLTETYAMMPQSSVCAYCFAHPRARYLSFSSIGSDQLLDYARRKQQDPHELRRWIAVSVHDDKETVS